MSSDHIAIRVSHLSKQYKLGGPQEPYHTLRDAIVNSLKAPMKVFHKAPPVEGFWALKDVSFEVELGEVVGIIGRNGAGKSTLLKILSRITSPTEGTVELHGRVGSLLEVGTGFHPELTGRENIYLSGSILGMKRREIDAKLDDIVKFSEIEKFLDTPVKRYSSGMYVRLAFAVAAHMDTEILLVDEVLAVGDAQFQKKSMEKMGEASKGEGKTVLFVSHNMSMISSLCSKSILLENGLLKNIGNTSSIIQEFISAGGHSTGGVIFGDKKPGDNQARLLAARIVNSRGEPIHECRIDELFWVEMEYELLQDGLCVFPNIHVKDAFGRYVFCTTDANIDKNSSMKQKSGKYLSRCQIPPNLLNSETYHMGFALTDASNFQVHFFEQDLLFVTISDPIEGIITRVSCHAGPIAGSVRPFLHWELHRE